MCRTSFRPSARVTSLTDEGCPTPTYLHCDLPTNLDGLKAAIDQVLATHGTVDVLVNNAANDQRHSIEEVTPEFWENSLAVNLRPQFFAMQAVLPAMRKAGRGSIINMSSIAWIIPNRTMPVYNTTKAAIVGLTRAFAHGCGANNIRVNAVPAGSHRDRAADPSLVLARIS